MVKKHLLRKGVAYLLSAAMVLGSNGLMPGGIKTASAAVTVPEPVINLDFNGTITGNTYTEDGIEYTLTNSEITNDPDKVSNKVFYNGSIAAGFMKSVQGAFADTGFSDGISIHMKIRPDKQESDWNYLFSLGYKVSDTEFHYIDGTIGFIMRKEDPYTAYFPNDGWQTDNNVNSDFQYFQKDGNYDKWYDLTYVYGNDGNFTMYVNGIPAVSYVATGYNEAFSSLSKKEDVIFSLGCGIDSNLEKCNAYYDDVKVYNTTLTNAQIHYLVTGEQVQEADKEALDAAISEAEKINKILYTDESLTILNEKLNVAKGVKNNLEADQDAVDAATSGLNAAIEALVLKPVDLTTDLVLDSDMTSATSVIDKEKKEVVAGGNTITALGTSSIGDGYIQSSESGEVKKAGVSLDASVLEGVSLDKGLTFNIKWKFSTAPKADWWDLVSIVDESDTYLMRNTVGFVSLACKENVFPETDCKNGFAWDSCKSYETDIVKNLAVTIDNTGFRMYVDGVLACEKTDMTKYDFDSVFANMAKVYIGHALIDGESDGDLQGQLYGLQVYHRALNLAEVATLADKGTGISFEVSSPTVSLEKGATQTVSINDTAIPSDTTVNSAVSGDNNIATAEVKDGKLVITGVGAGETKIIVNTSYGQSAICDVNVYTEKVDVTGVALDKETASIEKGAAITLVATVSPDDASEKGIIWKSSDETVATVNSNGVVTAVAAGTATITATSKENADISASCAVTVTESSSPGGDGSGDDDVIASGELNDESQLGKYRSDLAYNRVGVHDPSIVQDPETKKYYLFGSHCAWAWSEDLENWTSFTNNITEASAVTIFADEIAWCKKAKADYTITGNLWAPDVIWSEDYVNEDGSEGAWLMYMSINGPDWNSTISLLTADSLDGNWTYAGPVIQSGMSKGYGVTFDYTKVTGEAEVNSRYTSNVSKGGNPTLEAHAIDPCVLYDDNGGLWMSYGSWSGGISMIKLDTKTGLRDYTVTYGDTNNVIGGDGFIADPYTGYKIAGGNAVSGEGSYIQKIGDYYFLFLSYGAYAPDGGYNMRIFRSEDIKGPYKDVENKDARYAGNTKAGDATGTTGLRLISYYKWSFADYGYTAQGHNSAIVDEDGKAYVIYHNKYNDGTAAHEVRVHQLLVNEDGWILAAPFEYAGETVNTAGYSQSAFTGGYGIMFQKQNIDHAKLECAAEQKIKLEEGTQAADGTYTGNITGDYTGTWTSKAGSPYVSLEIGNTTYKGIFCEGTIDETDVKTMTFTAVGDNQECLWGYKVKDPTVAIRMTIDKVIKIPDEAATDIPLPETGAGGSTITWSSNSVAINDDGTIPHLFNEDTKVSMTATISNNGCQFDKVYEFTVLGNEKLSKDSDVILEKLYTDNALDMSELQKGSTPSFPNPFYYTHEDISEGVSISFDVVRTAPSDRLSNLVSFNNKLGKLYFTGGSYLGYNDFNDPVHFMDANLNSGYLPGEDYLADNTKVTIKIEVTQDGFTVYQNGEKAYSSSDVKSGDVPGGYSTNNPEKTILSWFKAAPELNFGSGNFWDDLIFKGTISNVICSYKQPALNIESGSSSLSGLYTQDYENVRDISTEWGSTNALGNLSLGSGDEGHGKYMLYDFTGDTKTNSRGAHSYFGEGITWPDNYILEYDMSLKAGSGSNCQESQVAVITVNETYLPDSNGKKGENNGIDTGYVFKMTSTNSETWTINGDSAKTVTIPNSTWVHVTLSGTKDLAAAHLRITNGNTTLFDDDITATDTGTIKGLYMLAGRYQATYKIDNIVVKEPGIDYVDRTAYDKILKQAEQHKSAQEANQIYTDETYKVLADAIDTAKSIVTNTSPQDIVDTQAAALKEAINGLERKICTVTVEEAENGTVTGLLAEGRYLAGNSVTLKAVPDSGYEFGGWKVGGGIVRKNTTYSAMVKNDITITPVFEKSETPVPTPTPTGDATVTPTPAPTDDSVITSSPAPTSDGTTTPSPAPTGDGKATPSPAPTGSGSGIGSYIPGVQVTPGQPGTSTAPSTSTAPGTTGKPETTPAPETTAKPEVTPSPAPGTTPDVTIDEETGAVTEVTTTVDDNKTTVIEKVTMPDGEESIKETVTESMDSLTVVTETLTNSETASVLVTKVTSDTDGNVVDASAVVYTGLSDRNSNYSSKTVIPEAYLQNVKEAGIGSVDIYVEKPTVDAVKNNLGRKMVVKIAVPQVDGVSVGKVIVTKDSISSAKESSRKLVVKIESENPSNSYTITIPQSELKKMDKDIDVSVKTGKVSGMGSSNSKKVNKILSSNKVGTDNSYVVTIASNNTKGGIKVTTPAMLPSVKEGDKVYAYRYNKKTGKLEEIPNSKRTVIEDGEAAIEGFSGNSYVITDKELSGKNVVTLLGQTKVSVGKTSVKPGSKTKVKVNLGTGLVAKPSVNSSAPYAKQAAVVTYKSSNPKKVKVSKDGTITAKGKGKATVTVKIKLAGGKVKTVKKTVVVK